MNSSVLLRSSNRSETPPAPATPRPQLDGRRTPRPPRIGWTLRRLPWTGLRGPAGLPDFPTDVTPEVAFRAYLHRERSRWIATDALVRMIGSATFLATVAMLWLVTARRDWFVYLVPLAVHLAASLFAWALRKHRLHHAVGVVMALADVALVFAVQWLSMPESPFPAGVAGFSLGLFAMVLVLDAELLPRGWVFVLAAEAYVFQATLMHTAGVSPGPIVLAGLVLGMVAWTVRTASERMEALIREQVEAQLARAREAARARELEQARQTIERLLEAERAQNERLVNLQREKDQLTHLLVHDLRAPLTGLVAYVDLMRERLAQGEATPALAHTADETMRAAERLTGMIHAILDVAKMEDGRLVLHRQPISLGEVIHDVVRDAQPLARKQAIHLLVECDPDLRIDADRELIRRVLDNLVSNALRYTPRHRRVRVAAEWEGAEVVIRVQNEGLIIDPARRAGLFQKFGQLEGQKVGWGLGLYFCRLATEAHQGSIRLEDTPDWNVTFAVRLPLAGAAEASWRIPIHVGLG